MAELGPTYLPEAQVVALIEAMEDAQPFTVVFTKRDGTQREMPCSVSKELRVDAGQVGLTRVFDRVAGRVKTFRDAFVERITVP